MPRTETYLSDDAKHHQVYGPPPERQAFDSDAAHAAALAAWKATPVDARPVAVAVADDRTIEAARAEKAAAIKVEAQSRILAELPLWKQLNMLRRYVVLGVKSERDGLDAVEQADLQQLDAAFDRIDAVREASNVMEAQLAQRATNVDVDAVNHTKGWPK